MLLPILRPCAVALALALPLPAIAADVAWRFFSQLPLSSEGLPVFADLDGDGFDEIVFGMRSENNAGMPGFGLTVLAQVDGALERVVSVALPQTLFSLVPVRRPGQADSVLVTVGMFGATQLMEFAGRDLELVRNVVVPDRTRLQEVVDLDANGTLDILAHGGAGFSYGPPLVFDYTTATLQWQGTDVTEGVTTAQLDLDPALEIISRSSVGRIYDGATKQQEWAWPSGFGQSVVGGRFEADPLVPGFVISGNGTTVFRASPYSPLREFLAINFPVAAFDADGDGRDELYASRPFGPDLIRISAEDGSIESLVAQNYASTVPRLGRLEPAGPAVAATGTLGSSSSQVGTMLVFDLESEQARYQADFDRVPWWPSAFLQRQPSGALLAASLVGRLPAGAPQFQVDLELRDAATGERVASRPNVFSDGSATEGSLPMAADIDGTPGDEIVVLRVGAYAALVALLDGATLQDRWRVGGFGSILDGYRLRGWALVDRNQDGVKDIVLATSAGWGSAGIRLLVLSGVDGSVLWQSVTIAEYNAPARVGLLAGEIDAQPGSEIVLAVGNAVYAFDTQSGLVTWILKPIQQQWFTDLVHWGSGDDCRIGVVIMGQTLRLVSCEDRQTIAAVALPVDSQRVTPLDAQGRMVAVVTSEDLLVSRNGGAFQPVATGLGAGLDLNAPWAVRTSPDATSLLLGSSLQVLRLDLEGDRVFSSGFETFP